MKKIAKMNPQPDENGIFATGFTRKNKLDENGREIYDPDWDLKPFGEPIGGAWLAEPSEPWLEMPCVKQGRFSACPIENVSVADLFDKKIKPVKIDDEWWWVETVP